MPPVANESKEIIPDTNKTGPITDDELADLSEEERAALQAEDDDTEALNEIAGEGDDKGGEEAEAAAKAAAEAKAKAEAEAKATADAEAAAKQRAAELAAMPPEERAKAEAADKEKAEQAAAAAREQSQAQAEEEDDDDVAPVVFKAPPPENYEERVKALDDRYDAAVREHADNKITTDEMLAEIRKVDAERRELDAAKLKHEISQSHADQTAEQLWERDVRRFISSTLKAEGIDYNKPGLNSALDAHVKALANDKANADKDGKWFLEQAHARVKEEFGLAARRQGESPEEKAKREAAEKKKQEAAAQRKKAADGERAKAAGTKTLAGVPAAGDDDTSGNDGEFAHLEGLDGMELENAVARMTPEQQERWARA